MSDKYKADMQDVSATSYYLVSRSNEHNHLSGQIKSFRVQGCGRPMTLGGLSSAASRMSQASEKLYDAAHAMSTATQQVAKAEKEAERGWRDHFRTASTKFNPLNPLGVIPGVTRVQKGVTDRIRGGLGDSEEWVRDHRVGFKVPLPWTKVDLDVSTDVAAGALTFADDTVALGAAIQQGEAPRLLYQSGKLAITDPKRFLSEATGWHLLRQGKLSEWVGVVGPGLLLGAGASRATAVASAASKIAKVKARIKHLEPVDIPPRYHSPTAIKPGVKATILREVNEVRAGVKPALKPVLKGTRDGMLDHVSLNAYSAVRIALGRFRSKSQIEVRRGAAQAEMQRLLVHSLEVRFKQLSLESKVWRTVDEIDRQSDLFGLERRGLAPPRSRNEYEVIIRELEDQQIDLQRAAARLERERDYFTDERSRAVEDYDLQQQKLTRLAAELALKLAQLKAALVLWALTAPKPEEDEA